MKNLATDCRFWGAIALLVVAALGCESPTPVAPAESGLSISANPTRIDIDGSAEITVIARKSDGSAVNEGTEINFSTDIGTVQPAIALTNDRGLAEATLTGDGRAGTATVEASSGAAAPVTVEVQIGAQPTSLTLQANPPFIPKEGGEVTLVATVLDDLANPIQNVTVRFTTEAGTLASGGRGMATNNLGEATDTLTLTEFDVTGVEEGFFLVTATTVGADGLELIQDFEIEIGGFIQTVVLTPSPGTVPAGGGEITLNALVLDDGGAPVPGVGVVFSAEVGTLASQGRQVFTDDTGVATDLLTITVTDLDAFTGQEIDITAQASGLGGEQVMGEETILISTSLGIITIQADLGVIPTDVTSVITLTATVFDDLGAPVNDAGVVFTGVPTCVVGITVCGKGTLANEGQILLTNTSGQVSTTLTVTPDDVTDELGEQVTSTITITAETLLINQTLSDSVTITVTPPSE